jgi:hypothetical protein
MDFLIVGLRFAAVAVFPCLMSLCLFGALSAQHFASGTTQDELSPAEARAVAKEAYIYGFPMVDGYRIQYAYFVDRNNPEFKAPWNQIRNVPRVFTPDDKVVQRGAGIVMQSLRHATSMDTVFFGDTFIRLAVALFIGGLAGLNHRLVVPNRCLKGSKCPETEPWRWRPQKRVSTCRSRRRIAR